MGQLTDTLRATLRDLAQSDGRLYRGLQEELGDPAPAAGQPQPLLEGDAPASSEELERLSVAALWNLCKARGIKGLSRGPVSRQVEALLQHPDGPPLRSALPTKAGQARNKASRASRSGTADLLALEQRLVRLEQLVQLIAQQVGVPPESIARLAAPSVLSPLTPGSAERSAAPQNR
ncbi:MAG: hypothetical protein ACKO45_05755 [Cyanobium sp.]